MTLTELKYIVALARERHFGKAAETCHVSQPTLSVAIRKLEDELGVQLFERQANDITLTPLGDEIVRQAQVVLEQAQAIREIAKRGQDPLAGPLRLGVIYTIAPYLLPDLVRRVIERTPQMPLILQENFTVRLLEQLRLGEIDCAILAEPFPEAQLSTQALYDEPFWAAVPANHALASRATVNAEVLKRETMLLLANGHCFRDHVLEVCPEFGRFAAGSDGISRSFEGSSLETIKHMVAAGMGVTLVPRLSVPPVSWQGDDGEVRAAALAPAWSHWQYVRYLPFEGDVPTRRVVLAWRKSFTRLEAIHALHQAVMDCELPGVTPCS